MTNNGETSISKVIVYHDETKDVPERGFKGHVLLFVPVKIVSLRDTPLFGKQKIEYDPRKMLYKAIESVRERYHTTGKLHFSQLSGKRWKKYDNTYYEVISLAVDALRHNGQKQFQYPLCLKVAAMFYPKSADWGIYGNYPRKELKLRHDETVLRMLLKGAAHYLYDENHRVELQALIADGESAHRHFDEGRVIWRLLVEERHGRTPLRDYVSLAPDAFIRHLPSDHNLYKRGTEEYIHATMLQVSDLLLGTIMRASYVGLTREKTPPKVNEECNKRDIVSWPVREMLEKTARGGGFKHSGHYRSFTLSEVVFSSEGVRFRPLDLKDIKIQDENNTQLLFSKA